MTVVGIWNHKEHKAHKGAGTGLAMPVSDPEIFVCFVCFVVLQGRNPKVDDAGESEFG